MTIKAYGSLEQGKPLEIYEYDPGALGPEQVEIDVVSCGICHSDLSMLQNDWGMTAYPFVPGHEVAGKIAAVGESVKTLKVGDRVGLGWFSHSCMGCRECMSGDHNLCTTAEMTIVGRHGGFANKVRANQEWVIPLPDSVDIMKAGPMFCGGITVFNPIVQNGISPKDHVGVVGIGGLGHLALQFLNAWGCEVTAFTSPSKIDGAKELGAHHTLNSRDPESLKAAAGTFDMILVTSNVDLNWDLYISLLKPRGVLHMVGAAAQINATVFPLMLGQKSIKGSPLGSPQQTKEMMEFAGRHRIAPVTEHFPMSKVNDAMDHLKSGNARYRIVLEQDL